MQMTYDKNAPSPIAIAKAAGCYGDPTPSHPYNRQHPKPDKPEVTHPERFENFEQCRCHIEHCWCGFTKHQHEKFGRHKPGVECPYPVRDMTGGGGKEMAPSPHTCGKAT
jgi:hypothetical protein